MKSIQVIFQRVGKKGNEKKARAVGMENVISPIVSPSASAKASHNFAHPDVMSLSFCTHVNRIYGFCAKVDT